MKKNLIKPCVIGLGYVGLPILINLSKKYKTIGYDNDLQRIKNLKDGKDFFNEFKNKDLKKKSIVYSHSINLIKKCNLYIITVPTPILENKNPDLKHLKDVCKNLSKIIKKKDIIIFESTVYPGITNDYCIPLIEKPNFREGDDFFVGYSPERVNPGDQKHSLRNINKIIAYPHSYNRKELKAVYSLLCKKLIFSKNIREAETAKVIENIQRDVNIGLINEIYLVCKKLNLNFSNIIELASTKWNFIKFKPGLVGGHCLPVDPYYFAHVSKRVKINSRITLAGRTINDSMMDFAYNKIIKELKKYKNKKILICGLSYKENVSDIRNSLALKIFKKLKKNIPNIKGYDPIINTKLSLKNNVITAINKFNNFDVYVLITKHKKLQKLIKSLPKNKVILSIFD